MLINWFIIFKTDIYIDFILHVICKYLEILKSFHSTKYKFYILKTTTLEHHCPIELSTVTEMSGICTVQYSSYWPHMAVENLNEASAIE